MIKLTLKSEWGEEKKVLRELDRMLKPCSFLQEDIEDLKTAAAEACLNAIEHGNGLNPFLPVHVLISRKDRVVKVDVRDCRRGGKESQRLLHSLEYGENRGWGLLFIDNLVDEWEAYIDEDPRGFGIRLTKKMRTEKGAGWVGTGTDD